MLYLLFLGLLMKNWKLVCLSILLCLTSPVRVSAQDSEVSSIPDASFAGKKFKGTITGLYVERFEHPYKNWWFGTLVGYGDSRSKDVYIEPKGKEPGFRGVLSLDCYERSAYWSFASIFDEIITENKNRIKEHVPREVVRNAIQYFCAK